MEVQNMANIIQLLDILKWNTDENHALTQESLRKLPGADQCMGYKSTFKKQLFSLADTYNSSQNEKHWKIIFPGYHIKKSDSAGYYTGPIFYKHEINSEELYFILKQIHGIPFEQKANLILRLIRAAGSKHSPSPDNNILETIDFSDLDSINFADVQTVDNIKKLIQTHEYPTYITQNFYNNLNVIGDAISRERLLSFSLSYITENGELKPLPDANNTYLVSPYRIVLYKGYYWLIGNKREGTYTNKDGIKRNKYSDTLDVFRIDKLTNLTIAKNSYELRSKTSFVNVNLNNCLNLMASKIHVYKENTKIKASDITNNYGIIEFEILWDTQTAVNDYGFIFDSFGNNFSVRHENGKTIARVQANENCFIDWALVNIDKISILDTQPNSKQIKDKIRFKLNQGLKNL